MPNKCRRCNFVNWSDSEEAWTKQWESHPVEVLIFEGKCRPARATSSIWDIRSSLQVALFSCTFRGPLPQGWRQETRQISNAELGGTTDWNQYVHVMVCRPHTPSVNSGVMQKGSSDHWFHDQFMRGTPCRLTSLVDKVTAVGTRCKPPNDGEFCCERDMVPLEWLHHLKSSPRIKLSTVYGKGAFCFRRLTGREAAQCWDLPGVTIKPWTEAMQSITAQNIETPVKVAASLGRCLRACLRVLDTPGIKRHCDVEDPLSQSGQEIAGDEGRECVGKKQRTQDIAAPDEVLRYNPGYARMDGYTLRVDMEDTSTKSAVKHDHAEVPTHLWNDRVQYLLGIQNLSAVHLWAFDMMRAAMLRRWRRNVVTLWHDWWSTHSEAIKRNEPDWWKLVYHRGGTACAHARDAQFWAWPRGSGVFF
ncbi:hypothetical protein ACA910_018670 [Epithemia clementina (nom. ined.)]